MSVNNLVLSGRIGKEPVVKTFDDGSKKARVLVLTDDGYMGKDDQWVERSDPHTVEFGGKMAERIEKMIPGDYLEITGSVHYKEYEDRDGNKRIMTYVRGRSLNRAIDYGKVLAAKAKATQTQATAPEKPAQPKPAPQKPEPAQTPFDDDDDLPF